MPRNPALPWLFFPGRGRHVPAPAGGASGLSFCGVLPPSLLSSVVFSVLVSRKLSRSRRCAVAIPAIRGVSRSGRAASPCSGKVPPDFERAVAPRAQGADPRTAQLFRYQLGIAVLIGMFWDFGLVRCR